MTPILHKTKQIYVKGSQTFQYLLSLNLKEVEIINLETLKEMNPLKLSKSLPSVASIIQNMSYDAIVVPQIVY